MAEADRREDSALSQRLFSRGYEFEFFQAVRLLEFLVAENSGQRANLLVGQASNQRQETIRFGVPATTSFPPGAVADIRRINRNGAEGQAELVQIDVAFLGLTGPSGVLPQHYGNLVVSRSHVGDHTLREFLDIFHHRAIVFFFEAWRKYHFPFAYEAFRAIRGQSSAGETSEDLFTFCLRSLVGLGTKRLDRRLAVDDQAVIYYSGHYSQQVRSAIGLESLLRDYFALPVEVRQFQGRWINLPADQQTSLPTSGNPRGQHCSLGRETIVGSRIWDVQSAFRVTLGPIGYAMFQQFMPSGLAMKKLCDLVRLYAGPALSFYIQPILRKEEIPKTQLGRPQPAGSRLGWNTWLRSEPARRDADGVVFRSLDAG